MSTAKVWGGGGGGGGVKKYLPYSIKGVWKTHCYCMEYSVSYGKSKVFKNVINLGNSWPSFPGMNGLRNVSFYLPDCEGSG